MLVTPFGTVHVPPAGVEVNVWITYRDDPAVPEDTDTPEEVALEITCLELDAVTVTERVEDASFVKPLAPVIDDA